MRDRTLAVVITVLVVILCGCPGLAFLCFGLTDFFDYYALRSYIFGITSIRAANVLGSFGVCLGILGIAIAIIVGFFVLRKKTETLPLAYKEPLPPASSDEPLPPTGPSEPPSSPSSDEPLPPTGPSEPPSSPSSNEPLPPAI